ncbi:M48 family metallopeptidase [Alkalimonas collagenimarina]|uniref:M48 family metallopeptidase n=1 Tax=Alkalimonas collagenimarina TaxID=400390 RepID=A0ABT9H0R5_9GAMM|nr:M48 family metallopeptidase [Alkalimonas collagenimarina]MDP4536798.1 M48 family metallopeptidase [Alkalimonas collagenimarina]
MRNYVLMLLIAVFFVVACAESPTGRRQIMLFNENQLNTMGSQTFDSMKEELAISTDQQTIRYVQCVADALLRVTPEEYMGNEWEVIVFADDQVNAFALPGGKIGVYTGLLKVAENQHQLAAVVGHEIGHVMAGHANERLSRSQMVQTGLVLTDAASRAANVRFQQELMAGLGLGSQVGLMLPFSREHETEADIIGLDLMAQAGFQPEQSVNLWRNMAAASGGQSTPQLLSSHPVPDTRIRTLQQRMPAATATFQQRQSQGRLPNCGQPGKL